jgi:hypothetical protein
MLEDGFDAFETKPTIEPLRHRFGKCVEQPGDVAAPKFIASDGNGGEFDSPAGLFPAAPSRRELREAEADQPTSSLQVWKCVRGTHLAPIPSVEVCTWHPSVDLEQVGVRQRRESARLAAEALDPPRLRRHLLG